jgi:hypothetical protein
MDKNEIDNAAHEIQQMIAVLHRSIESLLRSGKDPEFFQLPAADAALFQHFRHRSARWSTQGDDLKVGKFAHLIQARRFTPAGFSLCALCELLS